MYPTLKKLSSALLILTSLPVSTSSLATQLIEGSEHRHVQVNVSAHEQNRLAIDGRRIGSVVPSQKGALVYAKDEAAGALYFSFPKEASSGTVTLFVTDEHNPTVTYKLILTPRAIAGEEVVIKPVAGKVAASTPKNGDGKALSYQRRIKEFILGMAQEDNPDGEAIAVNQIIPLWKEAQLVLLSNYTDGGMVGEKYSLTNNSDSTLVLTEQELYRRGVMAVAIEHQTLPVNGQTLIFIVRGRKAHE